MWEGLSVAMSDTNILERYAVCMQSLPKTSIFYARRIIDLFLWYENESFRKTW